MKTIFFGTKPHGLPYHGYVDAVRLARHFNPPEDVVALTTDKSCQVPGAIQVPEQELPALASYFAEQKFWAHYRWAVNLWYCRKYKLEGPVYFPDWDVLHFGASEPLTKPFWQYPISRTYATGHGWSSCYLVGDVKWLYDYWTYLEGLRYQDMLYRGQHFSQDMHTWSLWVQQHGIEGGNLAEPTQGWVWDHNIHTGAPEFVMEPASSDPAHAEVKKIVWKGNQPHFVLAASQELVKAACIHCWGTFKNKTKALADRAIN